MWSQTTNKTEIESHFQMWWVTQWELDSGTPRQPCCLRIMFITELFFQACFVGEHNCPLCSQYSFLNGWSDCSRRWLKWITNVQMTGFTHQRAGFTFRLLYYVVRFTQKGSIVKVSLRCWMPVLRQLKNLNNDVLTAVPMNTVVYLTCIWQNRKEKKS